MLCAKNVSGILAFLVLLFPAIAGAQEGEKQEHAVSLGAGVVVSTSEYKDYDATVLPLPIISYEGERFFIRGLTGGIHLYKSELHEVSLIASYMPHSFDASESDSHAMRQLDDRYSSLFAGASYALTTEYGTARIAVSADTLDTSNGMLADLSYSYPFTVSIVKITPNAGVLWTSGNYNDYYYGVDGNESEESGLRKYEADDGASPYAGVRAQVDVTDAVTVSLFGNAMYLDSEITDSPMVDKDYKFSFGTGIAYSF